MSVADPVETRRWGVPADITRRRTPTIPHWSRYAWAAIGVVAGFIAITCWWLTQDHSVPIYDAGDHLRTAIEFHSMIAEGNLLGPITLPSLYPIFGPLVGAVAIFIGGVSVASPIIGENLVFISLLALGCYRSGRLLFGPAAGLLAVIFVLGSPLIMSMFHVFLLDSQVVALVAVAVWLMLESEDFSRVGTSAAAGLAVGVGMNVKVQFATFVAGLFVVMLLHGGWRNRLGIAVFVMISLVVGLPWYVLHAGSLGEMLKYAGGGRGITAAIEPPELSINNFTWYFWSVLNSQLFAPLFLLAAAGTLWTVVAIVRERAKRVARLEFVAGAFLAWLTITFATPHHDVRYGAGLLAFVAVIATGWIVRMPRAVRAAALTLLVLGVLINTLSISFGVGPNVIARASYPGSHELVVFSTSGFLVSAPRRDGDVPALLGALQRAGVRRVTFSNEQSGGADFGWEGLFPLVEIAGMYPVFTRTAEFSTSPEYVTLLHGPIVKGDPPPCTRLSDGTGVWVARYDARVSGEAFYCPTRHLQFYAPVSSAEPRRPGL